MAGSIAAQLQAIKSQVRGREDPIRRPFTRPSILFDPKEAADLDLRAILPIAVSGLDVLIKLDARFESYKKTLFSSASLEVDREKLVPKEEDKVNKSVVSYLQLLAGHLHLQAAMKTLEYLIRRYKVHVFNVDELVLCALPYHDTPQFVRIVQLIDLGNSKWRFLEGVKASGAPPPRKVIVQQCLCDKGVLEALCSYASPTNVFSHSRPVVCFCTAVIVEALGSVQTLDDETVSRVLPFVFSGLSSSKKGRRDEKAGALMVVGLLGSRATLASKLINNLISFIARVAQQEAKESADVPWIRVILMAMISIVQSQSIHMLPKKSLKIFMEIRNLSEVLAGLAKDFNIEKFLSVYLQTLADDSLSDDDSCSSLIMALDSLPVKNSVACTVGKVLASCLKLLKNTELSTSHEAGVRAKKIYLAVSNNYQSELTAAVQNLLKQNPKEGEDILEKLSLIFDGNASHAMSDSHILFSLEHPQFFPEANEVEYARKHVFGGASFKLDYLTKPSLFEDFGFVTKVKMADRVKPDDEIFLVAYPYFNVNEMLTVEELYKEAVLGTSRKLIVFNGELDRIRSGYYPSFFYPKLATLSNTFLPKLETVYYIHNFKGRNGGVLFRAYPGLWRVLRKVKGKYICLHQQEHMPSLKEVALDILPSA